VDQLGIDGDFNGLFSALVSVRADLLLTGGTHEIDWRAVQHDTAIPASGEVVDRDIAAGQGTVPLLPVAAWEGFHHLQYRNARGDFSTRCEGDRLGRLAERLAAVRRLDA